MAPVGPADHLPVPSSSSLAVGISTMGPNPATQQRVRVGVKNTDVCTSSKPVVASGLGSDVIATSGWTMTFHAGVAANGNRGSKFTLSPVFPRGPTPKPVTDSTGTLIDAAKGFSASLARSCAVMAGRGDGGGSGASCARTMPAGHPARIAPGDSMSTYGALGRGDARILRLRGRASA